MLWINWGTSLAEAGASVTPGLLHNCRKGRADTTFSWRDFVWRFLKEGVRFALG
jgi:hypothetical protein